jgi:hypothetical protein
MGLSDKVKQHYFNLKKGFEGEKLFDSLTEKLQCECLILNDLLLSQSNTLFQIDTLIITQESIYFFELKNFEGDHYYESGRFYRAPNNEISNPLTQLDRSESLLRRLLQSLGFSISIDASVVFINPEFTLYQTPLNKPFIFPTQINRFLKKMNVTPSKLTRKHKILADKLISLHITDSPFTRLPPYEFDQLQKGVTCVKCSSFSISVEGRSCFCKECGQKEAVSLAVLRNVKEFKLLFPDQKITTSAIYDWFKVVESKKRIRRILEKNYHKVGVHQWAYYE